MLLSFEGKNDTEISKELRVAYKTVRNRIQRVLDNGVKDGLKDKRGAGKPRTISDESRVWLIKVVCTKPKDLGYPHEIWSQRLLARHIRKSCIKEGHPDLLRSSHSGIIHLWFMDKIAARRIHNTIRSRKAWANHTYHRRFSAYPKPSFKKSIQVQRIAKNHRIYPGANLSHRCRLGPA